LDSKITAALEQLNRLPEEERLAALELLIEKRKSKSFIKYFEPWSEQADAIPHFTEDIKVFGLLGGNRSGKTILGAFIAVAWALGKSYFKDEASWQWVKDLPIPEDHPRNVWIVGLDFNVLRDVLWFEKLRHGKNHPPFLPDDGSVVRFSDKEFQVFFANGSIITGKSADSGREKFQGASVDLVWIDEECDKDIYDECFMRTSDCAGKILLTLTPLTDMDSGVREPWVYDLYEEWAKGDSTVFFANLSTLHSPFISDKEKDIMLKKLENDPLRDARLYGKFVRRSGLVYPQWKRESFIRRDIAVIPPSWPRIVSIDPAATGTTAALWIAVDPQGNYYLYREYYQKDLIVSEHVKNILFMCAGEPIDWWLLDPYWGGQRNAETHKTGLQLYRDAGMLNIRLPRFDSDEYPLLASMEYFNATITPNPRHPKIFILEGLPNFEFEISHYVWDRFSKGEQKGLTKEKPRKRNDHLMNALQYACSQKFSGGKKRYTDLSIEERRERSKLLSYT
jgi:phage terminase large subunit-like protein